MSSIIKSALYKLSKDWTFKITLIIGAAMAILMNLIYLGIDALAGEIGTMCNGQSFYISALSPTQNFGLTVPINLIIFTIGEFTNGTIRNKIIAGHKKSQIYLSLLLIGTIFTILLMGIYWVISFGIASLIGGFDVNGSTMLTAFKPEYLYQFPIMALATYIFITAFAIFVSVSIRTIGGTMPLVIIGIMLLYFLAFIPSIASIGEMLTGEFEMSNQAYINPMYTFGTFSIIFPEIDTKWFIASIACPLFWTVILTIFGIGIFKKSDVK